MYKNHQQDPGTAKAEPPTLQPLVPATAAGSCCGGSVDAAAAAEEPDDVVECPVMTGTPVNKAQAEAAGLYRDHNGQRYWFCCAACGPTFDADPDEYAAA